MKTSRMSQEDIDRNLQDLDQEIMQEGTLLQRRGVSQKLFDISCDDMESKEKNKPSTYEMILPSISMFEKYGINNISGDQDKELAQKAPWPLLIY